MEHSKQVSLKNLITTPLSYEQTDFIEQNGSQQGSIIDLLRKDSGFSTNDIGQLGEARIRMTPEQIKSLKSMEQAQEENDYFMENSHSELIIEDVHLKKIQSERVPAHQYFGKNGISTFDS